MSTDEILDDFPELERADILAVLEYAAVVTRFGTVIRLPVA